MTLLDWLLNTLTGSGSSEGGEGTQVGSETGGGGDGTDETGGVTSGGELIELLRVDIDPIVTRLDRLEVGIVSLFVAVSLLIGVVLGVAVSKLVGRVWER